MPWWVAIRDNDAQKPVAVTEAKGKGMETAFATARKTYPPPKFETVLAMASNLEAFLKNYPRFQGAAPGGGTSAGTTPTPSTPPPAAKSPPEK
jgi:hypothetical protein